ncbi:hypothetical protein DOTSEDRAFT_69119 [Dothistroma septosporum NZE10]|uniref:Uncharacterized protein n=1 Tax=Dothistroma septosporum (strain NZE10 / CBS 128990) TaxID=675120 RepID=N1PU94_DOTSN|nr:hypothetical protein DOTSEDRAFT_69119 [Dothistroma septosporum NZE10]
MAEDCSRHDRPADSSNVNVDVDVFHSPPTSDHEVSTTTSGRGHVNTINSSTLTGVSQDPPENYCDDKW